LPSRSYGPREEQGGEPVIERNIYNDLLAYLYMVERS
jgi:hypothetical protein